MAQEQMKTTALAMEHEQAQALAQELHRRGTSTGTSAFV